MSSNQPDADSTLFTIGFSGRSAEEFFEALVDAGVTRVLDIRRSNTSQLAGYSKKSDLPYFLTKIGDIEYLHIPDLAPESDLFRSFRERETTWEEFQRQYRSEVNGRGALESLNASLLKGACLLCACQSHQSCHRRIAAEMITAHIPGLQVKHL